MSSLKPKIFITGVGAVTPFGDSPDGFFDGLLRQVDLYADMTVLKGLPEKKAKGVEVPFVKPAQPVERFMELGTGALRSALYDWGGRQSEKSRIVFVLGTGVGVSDQLLIDPDADTETIRMPASRLAENAGMQCSPVCVGSACSASSEAIAYAADLLREERCDMAVAGGVEALSQLVYMGFMRLHALDEKGCRPFDENRKGIMVGEGAAFFVMEREGECRGNKVYAALLGSGITNDAYHVVGMDKSGTQIKRAMGLALADAEVSGEDVDLIVAHATGTRLNDATEAECIKSFFGKNLAHVRVVAPKSAIGHTGGASGAFGVLTALECIRSNILPPVLRLEIPDEQCSLPVVYKTAQHRKISTAMINSFAFGGVNVVLMLGKAEKT